MVRHGRWKYIYHVGYRPELYDLMADPGETTDLAEQSDMASVLAECHAALLRICDPEAVNAAAFADQRRRIALHGGRDAVIQRGDYGYTPAPGEKPARVVT
jgi:choline-sulfatase